MNKDDTPPQEFERPDFESMSDKEAKQAWFKIIFESTIIPVMRVFWKK